MNGDETRYFDMKFEALVKLLDERHKETKMELADINGRMQCGAHSERMKGFAGQMRLVWTFILMLLGGFITGFLWMIRQ